MKYCYNCKEDKEFDQFGKNRSKHDGHQDECKSCRTILGKGWAKTQRVKDRANEGRTLRSDDRWDEMNEAPSAVMEALGTPSMKW